MICYETTFIYKAEGADESHRQFQEKIHSIISAHGGQVLSTEDWGKRRLAYPIQKEVKGHYSYILYTGNNTLVAELERNMRINEQVLRYLTVKLATDYDAEKTKIRKTQNVAVSVAAVTPVSENRA